jgi:hypothetical protein
VKKEIINNPKPSTARSPNLSTSFPETNPDENLIIAKLEIIRPMAVLLTPNDEAKIGTAGIIKPKPTATRKATEDKTETSRGSSAKGFLPNLFSLI